MKPVIAIVTHHSNWDMLKNLLKSIKGYTKYPILIVVNEAKATPKALLDEIKDYRVILNNQDGFELGALRRILEQTKYEEILLLQDSCEVKDVRLFDMVFQTPGSVAISFGFMSYMGKYERKVLLSVRMPITLTKTESVRQEGQFNRLYLANCERFRVLFGTFGFSSYKGNRFEHSFGRKNLVSENEYLINRKGTWSSKQLRAYEQKVKDEKLK